jgi:DNA-binding CsgD family transcriptional regulator
MDSAAGNCGQMSIDISFTLDQSSAEPVLEREQLVDLFSRISTGIGADHYLVIQCLPGRANETSRILVCNWVFDVLESVGRDNLARIVQSQFSTRLGAPAKPFVCEDLAGLLPERAVAALIRNGHLDFACQQLQFGQARYGVIFSSAEKETLGSAAVSRAQMMCCYALSRIAPDLYVECADPLSERERECLRWVSEGKTTDEAAVILGVSSNTVNSYITHAIQKLSATNRAMAMATAIRNGLI